MRPNCVPPLVARRRCAARGCSWGRTPDLPVVRTHARTRTALLRGPRGLRYGAGRWWAHPAHHAPEPWLLVGWLGSGHLPVATRCDSAKRLRALAPSRSSGSCLCQAAVPFGPAGPASPRLGAAQPAHKRRSRYAGARRRTQSLSAGAKSGFSLGSNTQHGVTLSPGGQVCLVDRAGTPRRNDPGGSRYTIAIGTTSCAPWLA